MTKTLYLLTLDLNKEGVQSKNDGQLVYEKMMLHYNEREGRQLAGEHSKIGFGRKYYGQYDQNVSNRIL